MRVFERELQPVRGKNSLVTGAEETPSLMQRAFEWFFLRIERRLNRDLDPRNQFLEDNFRPQTLEHSGEALVIEGELPAEIRGELLRIGPNLHLPAGGGYHIFDGDGMIHQLSISDGRAHYRNRWVETHRLKTERALGRSHFLKIGEMKGLRGLTRIILAQLRRALRIIDRRKGGGVANTALIYHHQRLYALHEGDQAYAVELGGEHSLETIGRSNFGDPHPTPICAHPKIDPATGELLYFGYDLENKVSCRAALLDASGQLRWSYPITLDEPILMHDCAFTERYFILIASPLYLRPKLMVKERRIPVHFDRTQPLRFGFLPRDAESGDEIRWIDAPNGSVVHTLNAWEEEGEVLLYACRSDAIDLNSFDGAYEGRATPSASREEVINELYRFRFDVDAGRCEQARVSEAGVDLEFPICPPALLGKKTEFAYLSLFDLQLPFKINGVHKYRLRRHEDGEGKAQGEEGELIGEYLFGEGRYGGESTFVPDPKGETEDAGYLLIHVHDERHDESYVEVIDARTMATPPVARIKLPARVPYGFHTLWVPQHTLGGK